MGTVFRILLFISIPSFFAYLAGSHSILNQWKELQYLGERFNTSLVKDYLLFFGILITSGYLTITNEINRRKLFTILAQRAALINQIKESALIYLENIIGDEHVSSIKFRVWREKNNIITRLQKKICSIMKINCPVILHQSIIDGLTEMDKTGLYFEVKPNIQGLVGICYNEREIIYEEDLSLVIDQYDLRPFQLCKVRSIRFCLCTPVFDAKDEIVAIITFESIHYIKISSEIELRLADVITNFSQTLYQNCPELFK